MVVERVNPCIRPLSVLHRGTMSAIRRIPAFIGLSRWSYRVLASSPENVLFVLGIGWNEVSNLSLSRDNHSATRPSFYSLRPFRDTFLRGTCLQLPRTGGRGFAHTARSVLTTIFKRSAVDLGCDGWDSNPRFPAYEAGDLATSLPRNINYFSLSLSVNIIS